MGQRQLELTDVQNVCADLPRPRVAQFPRGLLIAIHGLAAVESGRRDTPAGGAVDQEAGAAEAVEILERRQDGGPVEVDGSVDLIARHLDPRRAYTGAVSRAVLAVHRPDLPLIDRDAAATEPLACLVAQRRGLIRAGAQSLLRLPRAGGDALAGFPVDQQGEADIAIHRPQRGHDLVADERDPVIDGRGLRLDSGRARVHGPPPLIWGGAPVAPPTVNQL